MELWKEFDLDDDGGSGDDSKSPAPANAPAPAAPPKRTRRGNAANRGVAIGGRKEKGSYDPATAPPPPPPRARLESAAVGDVTVEDADALECGVCFLPLRPPIFQCDVGHVVCSQCCEKLKATGKCHVCGVPTSDYCRCHAMERVVESFHVPCPNAAQGCTARLAFYDQDSHSQTCPHAPCCCPDKDCGFTGSTEALLDHFTCTHGWPCTTMIRAGKTCSICLYDGFNFLLIDHTASSHSQFLFLLNVARQPLGRAISVLFIGRKLSSQVPTCVLSYSRRLYDPGEHHKFLGSHFLQSEINVECTDLSNGLPNPEDGFLFIVPDFVLGDDDKKNTIQVKIRICIVDLD